VFIIWFSDRCWVIE